MVEPLEEAQEPLLALHEVSFGYQRQPLVSAVTLRIRAGEFVGLLGPNGAGKTTLLRLFSGFLQPQQGQVLLQGRDLRHWGRRHVAQRIAVVPQELHMPFAFTVAQMVQLGRTPFSRSFLSSRTVRDEEIIQDALGATGIAPLAERIFNELSGGERQRVLIAMALAQQPAILLLDEPTSHLDIKYQVETLVLVQQLNRERGLTVIAAMHDLNLAARYFPRLLLFQRGIIADAGPAEVLEPELLSRVYGIHVQVGILRGAEHLSVLPPGEKDGIPVTKQPPARIFVIAGGGSGALLMRALADARLPFSAGVLNIGDSDHTLALRLAEHVITEQPYAPISEGSRQQVRAALQQAHLLVLCPTPIGPGNLALFQEAVVAAQRGLCVILLAPDDTDNLRTSADEESIGALSRFATQDYTQGEGVRCIEQMAQAGARFASSVSEAVEIVRASHL